MVAETTKVAAWGNSEAIRIPKPVLVEAGLKDGDPVLIRVMEDGTLEVSRLQQPAKHRRMVPRHTPTFDELFEGYEGGRLDNAGTWSDVDWTEAERRAWSS